MLQDMAARFGNRLLVDNAQALYDPPMEGIDTSTSLANSSVCRMAGMPTARRASPRNYRRIPPGSSCSTSCTAVKRNMPDFSKCIAYADNTVMKQYIEDEVENKLLYRLNVR